MKQDDKNQIRQARQAGTHKSRQIDVTMAAIDETAIVAIHKQGRRKRRIDYAKKISNDPFIMSV
jgi:hypothetical protein